MVKQNASVDASFWINACRGEIIAHVPAYFVLFAPNIVAAEVRYPQTVLGIAAHSSVIFDTWVAAGQVVIQDPQTPVDWFQVGENSAIALAIEQKYFLLMDDANPYHRAKAAGLSVVGAAELTVLCFDHGRISYIQAVDAIKQIRANKQLKRQSLTLLETLARRKGI